MLGFIRIFFDNKFLSYFVWWLITNLLITPKYWEWQKDIRIIWELCKKTRFDFEQEAQNEVLIWNRIQN